ncbi:MAG: DUF3363 domain-containing protein [Rhodobacteraceae bacterium]|nr:DUF3363 domain-containing protein [Paracoccaceae bacterium]
MRDAQDLGQGRIRAPSNLVQRLEAREIDRVGRTMAADRGRDWTAVKPGSCFGGELVGSTQLPSGRFAMIDDGLGFSLVPRNDALERGIGQQIGGVGLPVVAPKTAATAGFDDRRDPLRSKNLEQTSMGKD